VQYGSGCAPKRHYRVTAVARSGAGQGQPVEVDVDAYKGRTLTGHVECIQGATGARFALLPPDKATGKFTMVVQRIPVRVALDRRDPNAPVLRPAGGAANWSLVSGGRGGCPAS
jgi:hypothetical protein